MKPLSRNRVNRRSSSREFNAVHGRTKLVNLIPGRFRGSIRL